LPPREEEEANGGGKLTGGTKEKERVFHLPFTMIGGVNDKKKRKSSVSKWEKKHSSSRGCR